MEKANKRKHLQEALALLKIVNKQKKAGNLLIVINTLT